MRLVAKIRMCHHLEDLQQHRYCGTRLLASAEIMTWARLRINQFTFWLCLFLPFLIWLYYIHIVDNSIKFSQISTEKWRGWTEAENGLQARTCGHLSSSANQGGYSATSGTHSDCFTAIFSSLELPFATKLIDFTLMKKWECLKIQLKTLNSPWRGRAMGSRSQGSEAGNLKDKQQQPLLMISCVSWLNCNDIL